MAAITASRRLADLTRTPVTLMSAPADAIACAASRERASLIVAGFPAPGAGGTALGGQTLEELAETVDAPLLAARAFEEPPRRVMVAVGDELPVVASGSPVRALFANVTSIYCVRVKEKRAVRSDTEPALPLEEACRRIRAMFGLPPGALMQDVTLAGDVASELLDFAARFRIDMIVTGRRRRGVIQRVFGGSVSARLLRRANCQVLMIPPLPLVPDLHTVTLSNPAEWGDFLRTVTQRDAGRRVNLEIDDTDMGAQSEVRDYPLVGVTYDHRDGRAEIMLGDFEGTRRHVTHTVAGVSSVDLLLDDEGRDKALRIGYDGGQVLCTFLY
jgi:nucleotide-binding universal stress UspA family protein